MLQFQICNGREEQKLKKIRRRKRREGKGFQRSLCWSSQYAIQYGPEMRVQLIYQLTSIIKIVNGLVCVSFALSEQKNIFLKVENIFIILLPQSMAQILLKNQEIAQLGKLEQLFHNRFLTPQFLEELVAIYVKAIESFAKQHQGMKAYFMDKMQFVLSCPEISSMLGGEGSPAIDNIRQTMRFTQRPEPVSSKAEKEDRFQNYQVQQVHHHHQIQEHHHHYEQDKNKTKMKIDLKMKLMREVEENVKNIREQVKVADKKFQQNSEKIKNIHKNQEQEIKERIARRKNKPRRSSVTLKAKVALLEGQVQEPEAPPIQKQELIEAHRQLTARVLQFTIRATQRQRESQSGGKEMQARIKKTRDIDDSAIEQEHEEDKNETNGKMTKAQNSETYEALNDSQPRVKTTRRKLSSDEDEAF